MHKQVDSDAPKLLSSLKQSIDETYNKDAIKKILSEHSDVEFTKELTGLVNVEVNNKLSKSQVFRCLFEKINELIIFNRDQQGLGLEHLEIFSEALLESISDNYEWFIKQPEFESNKEILFENLQVLIGWEIYLRLPADDRQKIEEDLHYIDKLNWSKLLTYFSAIFCDAVESRKYIRTLIRRQVVHFDSLKQVMKSFHRQISAVMKYPIIKSHQVIPGFNNLKKEPRYAYLMSEGIDISNIFVTADTLFNHWLIENNMYSNSQGKSLTSVFVDENHKYSFLSKFTSIIKCMQDHKAFILQDVDALIYAEIDGRTVLYKDRKIGLNWIEYMIDSYVFDYDVTTSAEWNKKICNFSTYLNALLPAFESSVFVMELSKGHAGADKWSKLKHVGVQESDINGVYSFNDKVVFEHKSGIYYLVSETEIITCKPLFAYIFIKLKSNQFADEFWSLETQSTYSQVLNLVSEQITNTSRFDIFTQQEDGDSHHKDVVKPLVTSRLNKFVESAFLLPHIKSSERYFTSQILAAYSVDELYLKFRENKYQVFEKLINDYKKSKNLIETRYTFFRKLNTESIKSKHINPEFIDPNHVFLKLFKLLKQKNFSEFIEYLSELETGEFNSIVDTVTDRNVYESDLKRETYEYVINYETDIFSKMIQVKDYLALDSVIDDIKNISHDTFNAFISISSNVDKIVDWAHALIDSYETCVEHNPYDLVVVKPLSFNYIIRILSLLENFSLISLGTSKTVESRYKIAYRKWSILLKKPTTIGVRQHMNVFVCDNNWLNLDRSQQVYFIIKRSLLFYLIDISLNDPSEQNITTLCKVLDSYTEEETKALFAQLSKHELVYQFYQMIRKFELDIFGDLMNLCQDFFIRHLMLYDNYSGRITFSRRMFKKAGLDLIFSEYSGSSHTTNFEAFLQSDKVTTLIDYLIDKLSMMQLRRVSPEYNARDILSNLIVRTCECGSVPVYPQGTQSSNWKLVK